MINLLWYQNANCLYLSGGNGKRKIKALCYLRYWRLKYYLICSVISPLFSHRCLSLKQEIFQLNFAIYRGCFVLNICDFRKDVHQFKKWFLFFRVCMFLCVEFGELVSCVFTKQGPCLFFSRGCFDPVLFAVICCSFAL